MHGLQLVSRFKNAYDPGLRELLPEQGRFEGWFLRSGVRGRLLRRRLGGHVANKPEGRCNWTAEVAYPREGIEDRQTAGFQTGKAPCSERFS